MNRFQAILAPVTAALMLVASAPTPIVSGGLSSTLFNGKMRIKKMAIRIATADEATVPVGGKALTFTYMASNGTSSSVAGTFSATMADADGITINGQTTSVYSAYYGLEPGAASKGTLVFILPDKAYVPTKILLTDGNGPAFRVTLKPSDIPAH